MQGSLRWWEWDWMITTFHKWLGCLVLAYSDEFLDRAQVFVQISDEPRTPTGAMVVSIRFLPHHFSLAFSQSPRDLCGDPAHGIHSKFLLEYPPVLLRLESNYTSQTPLDLDENLVLPVTCTCVQFGRHQPLSRCGSWDVGFFCSGVPGSWTCCG